MTRKEEIKELESALRTVMNPFRDYDLETEAEIMIDDGWHKQEKGNWSIKKIGDGGTTRTCSNCLITQTVNVYNGKVMFRYCPYCGAEMENAE